MPQDQEIKRVTTPEGRIRFPNLFAPMDFDGDGKFKYSVQVVFAPGTDLSGVKAFVSHLAEKKWGADKKKWPKGLSSPIYSCDDKADEEGNYPAGMVKGGSYINFKSNPDFKPEVFYPDLKPLTDPGDMYSGCFGRVACTGYAWTFGGKSGVSLNCGLVQKTRDGDPLRETVKPSECFEALECAKPPANKDEDPFG